MKLTTFLCVACIPMGLAAQQWCPPGAEWLHQFSTPMTNATTHSWYDGDTLVGGVQAQRIARRMYGTSLIFPYGPVDFGPPPPPMLTHVEGDMVQLWSDDLQAYDTLVWFGATAGAHWQFPHMDGTDRLTVQDTGTIDIAGLPHRYLLVNNMTTAQVDTLRERIGGDYFYLDPWQTIQLDYATLWLHCYRDDVIPEYLGYTWQGPCDFSLATPELERTTAALFPNPGTDGFTLPLPPGTRTIRVLDAFGRVVLERRTAGGNVRVDAGWLPTGIYQVDVRGQDGRSTATWVKQ
jgi:hypothetical protein